MTKRLIAAIVLTCSMLHATTTTFTEPWTSSLDGWTFTQTSCGGTCADALLTTDGNPADSVSDKITGRSKAEVGFWKKAVTWTSLGVPSGDIIQTVNGSWDDKAVQTAIACTSSSTIGMQLFDSGNTVELSATAIEPNLNVAGDTAAWTNHDPTGAVTITSSTTAASTITMRFNVNPASGNNASAACELRGDNYKLVIVSVTPHLIRHKVTMTQVVIPLSSGKIFHSSVIAGESLEWFKNLFYWPEVS